MLPNAGENCFYHVYFNAISKKRAPRSTIIKPGTPSSAFYSSVWSAVQYLLRQHAARTLHVFPFSDHDDGVSGFKSFRGHRVENHLVGRFFDGNDDDPESPP